MNHAAVNQAASILWQNWSDGTRIDALPPACRPTDREAAYAVQAALGALSGQGVFGWKIAATSRAGQQHIGVDGPLAGRLLSRRVFESGANVALGGNIMRVAEAEFAFCMGTSLPPRGAPYGVDEVMQAVRALHCAIEIPDSRYRDFARVGAAQLIADNACACWFVLGPEARIDWRELDLVEHRVVARCNGAVVREGKGANVLGDPRIALTWIANELCHHDNGLRAGELITTGTCIIPVEISAGDHVVADFGDLGQAEARLV
ncbi:MAG: 2-keto-4-pentenoate hydratase [Burkholderiales bacterium]